MVWYQRQSFLSEEDVEGRAFLIEGGSKARRSSRWWREFSWMRIKMKLRIYSLPYSFSNFFYAIRCCVAINAKEGDCWNNQLIMYCLWCYTKCHIIIGQCMPSSLGHRRRLWKKIMLIKFTWLTKRKLDRVSYNWVHSINKGFSQVFSVNQDSIG